MALYLLVCTQYIEKLKNVNLKWCPSCISCKVSLVKASHVFLIKYSIYAWLIFFYGITYLRFCYNNVDMNCPTFFVHDP